MTLNTVFDIVYFRLNIFSCIGFDRGHRLKAKNFQVQVLSRVLRLSLWFVAGGLGIFNVMMNVGVILGVLFLFFLSIYSSVGCCCFFFSLLSPPPSPNHFQPLPTTSNHFQPLTGTTELQKQQRFTTKSLIDNPQWGDLVEFVFLGGFTLYFGISLWNYGKNYSMEMTAMPCTILHTQH